MSQDRSASKTPGTVTARIRDLLSAGPAGAREGLARLRGEHYAQLAIYTALKNLRVERKRAGSGGPYYWCLPGQGPPADAYKKTPEQEEVLRVLGEAGQPVHINDVTRRLGLTGNTADNTASARLYNMAKSGLVEKVGPGLFALPGSSPAVQPRYPELAGETFGYLKVRRLFGSGNGKRLWQCKCLKCGRLAVVSTGCLKSGNTKSCGCLHHKKAHNLTGKKFGKLTALELSKRKTKHGKCCWKCLCDCGRTATVSANQLTTRKTKSCGCLHKLRAEYKETVHDEDGVPHYAPRYAARILKVHLSTFYPNKRLGRPGWKTACPFNGGKGLPTKLLANTFGRKFDHFDGPTIDAAKKAMTEAKMVPEVAGYVYISDACAALGCSEKTLRRRLKADGVKPREFLGKGRDGKPKRRTYVPQEFVEKDKARRAGGTERQAAPTSAGERDARKGRGRPKGSTDRGAVKRRQAIIDAKRSGEYETNQAIAGALGFSREFVSRTLSKAGLGA